MQYYSPLRYPGGKSKISSFVRNVLQQNGLVGCHYYEPFAGGASVALDLLFREYVSRITINDKDPAIFSFWSSILNQTEEFCSLVLQAELTIEEWERQKSVQKSISSHNTLEVGFSSFYLNRCNRSGILSGGVIGGKKQTGTWKIDARFNKNDLINRIKRIALYSSRINVENKDVLDFLAEVPDDSSKKFVYLDPPYYVRGKDLYLNYFVHEDHQRIRDHLNRLNIPWILTYDDHPQISELYRQFRQVRFTLNYHAGKAAKGSEILIYPQELVLEGHEGLMLV